MGNCRSFESNIDNVLFSVLDTLADSIRNLAGFAYTEADAALTVANTHKSRELVYASALNGLGNTVDRNDSLLKFLLCGIVFISHFFVLLS